jgi:diaminopimelate epimerase
LTDDLSGLPFAKMSGSGNDFLVIDNREGLLRYDRVGVFARAVCRRGLSVGADGIVLIDMPSSPDYDFGWRYFNADGSEGEMCGNGAMCGARFAYLNGISGATSRFETISGPVTAEIGADSVYPRVKLAMVQPGPPKMGICVSALGRDFTVHAVTVGVPHIAIVANDADSEGDFVKLGRELRRHERFAPAGTNVNLIAPLPNGAIRMRTYERGVEDETLACGTGAVASAIVARALGMASQPTEILTTSGRTLRVDFDWSDAGATDVSLEGEARVVYTATLGPDAILS